MQTISLQRTVYEVVSVRSTPIAGREMLTLRKPGGTVKFVAFRDSNGHVSSVTRSPVQ